MKRVAFILSLILILVSCGTGGNTKNIKVDGKDLSIIDGDTFGVKYETHVVRSCELATPRNIHEEMNPEFIIKLEDSTSFESRKPYEIGDTIVYTIYKKNK